MADKKEEIFSRHLREVKAKRKSRSFDSLVKRLRLEQEFRNILVALKENDIAWQEVLPSLISEKEVEIAPDFIVWKHDVKVPIFLIEHEKQDQYTLSRNELVDYVSFLKKTDYDIVAAVWMSSPSFPCKMLKIVDIEQRVTGENEYCVFTDVDPFQQRILEFFLEKIPVWPVLEYERIPKLEKPERFLEAFESAFRETVSREVKKRKPRLPYRKKAIEDITHKELDKLCLVVTKYFKGEFGVKDVAKSLTNLVERE